MQNQVMQQKWQSVKKKKKGGGGMRKTYQITLSHHYLKIIYNNEAK